MRELTSSGERIRLTRKGNPEEQQRLRQVIHKIADDLTERAQLLRSFCGETNAAPVYGPLPLCDVNNCPYRKQFKQVLAQTIEEL